MSDFLYINQQPTWALKNIVKALSGMSLLNTEKENQMFQTNNLAIPQNDSFEHQLQHAFSMDFL